MCLLVFLTSAEITSEPHEIARRRRCFSIVVDSSWTARGRGHVQYWRQNRYDYRRFMKDALENNEFRGFSGLRNACIGFKICALSIRHTLCPCPGGVSAVHLGTE